MLKKIETISETSEKTRIPECRGNRNHLRTGEDKHFPKVRGPVNPTHTAPE